MVTDLTFKLFDFQEKTVMQLLDKVADSRGKQTIIVKSPTGSGKTIMLIDFVDKLIPYSLSPNDVEMYFELFEDEDYYWDFRCGFYKKLEGDHA